MGDSKHTDNLETRVSLTGVEQVQRGQRVIGAGFRALRGEVEQTHHAFRGLGIASTDYMVAGGMVAGIGAGMAAVLRSATNEAAQSEAVNKRLATALHASGKGGAAAASDIARYASELQSVTTANDEAIVNAAAMLASFKMSKEEIRDYLPRLLDIQEGYRKLGGEEMSLEQIAIMVGKGHTGQITGLRRVGIMVDQTAYKQRGYKAILQEIDQEYKGQARSAADTAIGSQKQLANAVGDLNEALGEGLVPIIKETNKVLIPTIRNLTELNKSTHGSVGVAMAIGAGMTAVTGGILLAMPGIKALRDLWIEVAGAAKLAQGAQVQAAGAGAAAAPAAAAGGAGSAAVKAGGSAAATAATAAGAGTIAGAATRLGWFARTMRGLGTAVGKVQKSVNLQQLPKIGAWLGEQWGKVTNPTAWKGAAAAAKGGVGRTAAATVAKVAPKAGAVAVRGLTAAGMAGAAGPAGIATEVGDWALGNTVGRLQKGGPGARIGTGGWLPNISLGNAIAEGISAIFDRRTAATRRKDAEEGSRVAEDYVRKKKAEREKSGPANAPIARDPAIESNQHLQAIVGLLKDQKRAQIGGGRRTETALNRGDVTRALYGLLNQEVLG